MILERTRSDDLQAERKAMIDRDHALPLTRQAELLELSRSPYPLTIASPSAKLSAIENSFNAGASKQ
jgi:hypothetical protein